MVRNVKRNQKRRLIETHNLSFEEWFELACRAEPSRDYLVADYQFPSESVRSAYLTAIGTRPEAEIRQVLRLFLLPGGDLGADSMTLRYLTESGKLADAIENRDFVRRLISRKQHTWPANTWILDLLPHHPSQALEALDAYLTAHIQYLPDGRINGLCDAKAVIRARYLERANSRDTLLALSPQAFEYLIGELYRRIGYEVTVTPFSRDGGCDVHARRSKKGRAEHLLIECKRYEGHIGVKTVRALLGVVAATNATKGVLVTTGAFTHSALSLERATNQIDLVGFRDLNSLLNEHFGAEWPNRLDFQISWFKRLQSGAMKRLGNEAG